MTFRVPVLDIRFPFGVSSRLIFAVWCVCGGFLLHFLECNFLTILLKPNYEKPMDTAEDVLDRGVTVLWYPYYDYYKEMALQQNESIIVKKLAAKVYVSKVSNIFASKVDKFILKTRRVFASDMFSCASRCNI